MRLILLSLMFALSACALDARAGTLADLEVYDRTAGQTLPLYRHHGRLYVAGEPRHEYELRLRNRSGGRLLAVGSVDGVNVLSGETASPDQGGYVLDAWGATSIAGWRKSLDRVAAFYFTALPDSYAARTGRPDDIGVIGMALYREKVWCCARNQPDAAPYDSRDAAREEAPAAAAAPESSSQGYAERSKSQDKLGTGHGRSEYSSAYETRFERASATPDEVISVYYDSRRNLVAQGVIPEYRRYAERSPNPFPGGFVPDP